MNLFILMELWLFSDFRKMELSSKIASIADDERFFIEECAEDE